jgi:hypothetical protein
MHLKPNTANTPILQHSMGQPRLASEIFLSGL